MATTDWEAIEASYRAGLFSVREIAAHHNISHTAINKRAAKDGWERDLKAKIKAKADALVSKREVSTQVSTETAISERQLISANAEVIANIRMEHRGDIKRARKLTNMLLDELEIQTSDLGDFEKLGELMRTPDDNGMDRMNDIYRKVIGMPNRVKSMKDLSDAIKTIIGLERQAYNIDDGAPLATDGPVVIELVCPEGKNED
jgi:hypothetical protein